MKIAVIIPDRGDRPEFLNHCKWMIENQSMKPDFWMIVDYDPKSDQCDITQRYRLAYHKLDGKGFDCVLFMENDDYYRPEYIETMINNWIQKGKPDLFGIAYTYYYHIGLNKYVKFDHPLRASMMNTLMKTDLVINWCPDNYPYTDAHLWKSIKNRVTFVPEKHISLGIKHGIGMNGGNYHRTKLDRYTHDDSDNRFLSSIVDNYSLNFYNQLHEKICCTF